MSDIFREESSFLFLSLRNLKALKFKWWLIFVWRNIKKCDEKATQKKKMHCWSNKISIGLYLNRKFHDAKQFFVKSTVLGSSVCCPNENLSQSSLLLNYGPKRILFGQQRIYIFSINT